ncbi:MAG: hypothetical protein A2148_12410 [Chloroflexi bacterium RBG_16_68_14]|nr:MAG: hypothetical protein A2148_12410 [Chloroflexi bacterium RBG_16_68_14]
MGAVLALGLLGQAWAQYPPPVGSLALAARDTTPDLGEEVAITASVLDENGEAAAGVECTFTIAEQPGDDAGVDPGPFTTDADGNVSTTLNTGSAEGAITVEATCGELSALVSVVAGAAAAPPASLPETGSGAQDSTNWAFWALIAAGAVVGVSGLAIAWRLAKA